MWPFPHNSCVILANSPIVIFSPPSEYSLLDYGTSAARTIAYATAGRDVTETPPSMANAGCLM